MKIIKLLVFMIFKLVGASDILGNMLILNKETEQDTVEKPACNKHIG